MLGRTTIEAIFFLRRLMKKYREACKDLHMVFIYLQKTYDRVLREIIWWDLEKKRVHVRYIKLIKDMCDRPITSVRTSGSITSEFPIIIGLHQGSTLSPFLFVLMMDELTKLIQ